MSNKINKRKTIKVWKHKQNQKYDGNEMNKNQFINKEILFININYIANEGRLQHKSCHTYPQDKE